MPYNADGTRAERTDPPTLPPDIGPPGSTYPSWGARFPEIVALGVCDICGWVHTRCKGHSKTWAGAPCSKTRSAGQLVCRNHGGAAPQAIRAAAKRIAERKAVDEAGALIEEAGHVIGAMDLGDQLVAAIQQAGAMALAYRWLLDQLPQEAEWSYREVGGGEGGAPVRWVDVAAAGLLGPDSKGVLQLHAYEEGLRHWTSLHGRMLVEAAKLGLDERRQLFAERQVAEIGDAVVDLVAGLGLDLDSPEVVPVVELFLRRVAGEQAAGTPAPPAALPAAIDVAGAEAGASDSLFEAG